MSQDFFSAIKKKTEHVPSRAMDQRILAIAERELKPTQSSWPKWALAGVPVAAALIIWLQVRPPTLPSAMLAESPEMLKHMDDIELWAEASEWNEEDWHYLATGET